MTRTASFPAISTLPTGPLFPLFPLLPLLPCPPFCPHRLPLAHVISYKRHLSNDNSGPPEVTSVSPDSPHFPSYPLFISLTLFPISLPFSPFSFPFSHSGFLARRSVGRSRSCCGLSKYGTSSHQVHRTGQRTLRFLLNPASPLFLQSTDILTSLQLTNVGIAVRLT